MCTSTKIKGIPQKLLAMEALLLRRPDLVGKVVLLQIAVPTRTEVVEYQKVRSVAHRLVGRINGKFGSPGWSALHASALIASDGLPCMQVLTTASWLPRLDSYPLPGPGDRV
jgi:trehalose-6-phosphate synthase